MSIRCAMFLAIVGFGLIIPLAYSGVIEELEIDILKADTLHLGKCFVKPKAPVPGEGTSTGGTGLTEELFNVAEQAQGLILEEKEEKGRDLLVRALKLVAMGESIIANIADEDKNHVVESWDLSDIKKKDKCLKAINKIADRFATNVKNQ